jgi:hypothetical protein
MRRDLAVLRVIIVRNSARSTLPAPRATFCTSTMAETQCPGRSPATANCYAASRSGSSGTATGTAGPSNIWAMRAV